MKKMKLTFNGNVYEKNLESCRAVLGFDGYIDELFRVVEKGDSRSGYSFYKDIPSFATRIGAAAGKSADLEIVSTDIKLGGNAPIMANALAALGIDTACMGAMGYPEIHPVFAEMAERLQCISVCQPAYTSALEFTDGKVMLANVKPLEKLNWEGLKTILGIDFLREQFAAADLIALVNWSGVVGAEDMWEGILEEVLPETGKKERSFFFDLADPSKKSKEEICAVMELMSKFSAFGSVVLGLNENEALKVYAALEKETTDLVKIAQYLRTRLGICAVVLHPIDRCVVAAKDGVFTKFGTVVENPRISTGGGDNFNAGFCLGRLLGMPLGECAVLGMRTSGWYVAHGYSPSLGQLMEIGGQ